MAGTHVGNVSAAIQRYVEANGFNVVREYSGHGVGTKMHEDPSIPNWGKDGRGPRLRAGMTFALEPMVMMGDPATRVLGDHWTVITADGKYGSHRFLGPLRDEACVVVVRLRRDRVLYGPPPPYAGLGRPCVHGERFAFKEPETWPEPDEEEIFVDERWGQVRLRGWHHLHAKQDADTPFTAIYAEVRLERERRPKPEHHIHGFLY